MAFFAALAMLLTLRAYEQPSWRAYLWPGIAAGLAAATKYNGGVALVLPLLALAMRRRHPDRLRSAAAAIGGAAGAFLLGAPYTVIDLPGFLNGFGALSYMYAVGPEAVEPVWMTYLKHLRINFGWPGVVLAAGSVGLAVSRAWFAPARERATWATLAAFVVIAFWLIAGQRLVWARYLLPILPPLAVLMGGAVAWIVRTVGRHVRAPILRWALAVGLFALVIAQPAMQATRWTAIQAKVGTAELTYRWVMDHIPAGSRVAIESRALLLPQARLRSDNVPRLIVWDLPHYRSEGYAYLIASSQAFGEALNAPAPTDATRAYRALFDRLELLVTILPTTEHPGEEWRVYRLPPE
jgi:4-amino-4-deoxy-L-arabinose transferase-like glycosyltransferase